VAQKRCRQPVELTTGDQRVLATQRLDRPLPHLRASAHAFHQIDVAVAPGLPLDAEHARVVSAGPCQCEYLRTNPEKCCYYTFRHAKIAPNDFNHLLEDAPHAFTSSCSSRAWRDVSGQSVSPEKSTGQIGPLFSDPNFGEIRIDWENRALEMLLKDNGGRIISSQTVTIDSLSPNPHSGN
jgi:hypothetical protein